MVVLSHLTKVAEGDADETRERKAGGRRSHEGRRFLHASVSTNHLPAPPLFSSVFLLFKLGPIGSKSISYGVTNSTLSHTLTDKQRMGCSNVWAANDLAVLDVINILFPNYPPIMGRLLHGECTKADLDAINARVIKSPVHLQDGSLGKISVKDCWNAQTITFRNNVRTTSNFILFACLFYTHRLSPTRSTPRRSLSETTYGRHITSFSPLYLFYTHLLSPTISSLYIFGI